MHIVRDKKALKDALESASREAEKYFGDGTVFIEQYIENPRHIEVQVLADHFGNVVHLHERECTIQRRYQKIIEESPSPTLTEEKRQQMFDTAVRLCKAIGYRNAGTVEFLVDKDLNFYFLEMNTRIQVEHPVTEMRTGIDIDGVIYVGTGDNGTAAAHNGLDQQGYDNSFVGTGLYTLTNDVFELVKSPSADEWYYINDVAVAGNTVIAATTEGLKYSNDKGQTWAVAIEGNAVAVKVASDNTIVAAIDGAVYIGSNVQNLVSHSGTGSTMQGDTLLPKAPCASQANTSTESNTPLPRFRRWWWPLNVRANSPLTRW